MGGYGVFGIVRSSHVESAQASTQNEISDAVNDYLEDYNKDSASNGGYQLTDEEKQKIVMQASNIGIDNVLKITNANDRKVIDKLEAEVNYHRP